MGEACADGQIDGEDYSVIGKNIQKWPIADLLFAHLKCAATYML